MGWTQLVFEEDKIISPLGRELVTGDDPWDIAGEYIERLVYSLIHLYQTEVGRKPTVEEVKHAIDFVSGTRMLADQFGLEVTVKHE